MTIERLLLAAADLVERGWTKTASAIDALNMMTPPTADNAERWSATGAINRIAFKAELTASEQQKASRAARHALIAHLGLATVNTGDLCTEEAMAVAEWNARLKSGQEAAAAMRAASRAAAIDAAAAAAGD